MMKPPKGRKRVTYVITDGEFFKIGRTSNLKQRIIGLQSGSPRKLSIVCYCAGVKMETRLHRRFKTQRFFGEWFKLTNQDVGDIVYLMGAKQ